jgi:hypothetical protein
MKNNAEFRPYVYAPLAEPGSSTSPARFPILNRHSHFLPDSDSDESSSWPPETVPPDVSTLERSSLPNLNPSTRAAYTPSLPAEYPANPEHNISQNLDQLGSIRSSTGAGGSDQTEPIHRQQPRMSDSRLPPDAGDCIVAAAAPSPPPPPTPPPPAPRDSVEALPDLYQLPAAARAPLGKPASRAVSAAASPASAGVFLDSGPSAGGGGGGGGGSHHLSGGNGATRNTAAPVFAAPIIVLRPPAAAAASESLRPAPAEPPSDLSPPSPAPARRPERLPAVTRRRGYSLRGRSTDRFKTRVPARVVYAQDSRPAYGMGRPPAAAAAGRWGVPSPDLSPVRASLAYDSDLPAAAAAAHVRGHGAPAAGRPAAAGSESAAAADPAMVELTLGYWGGGGAKDSDLDPDGGPDRDSDIGSDVESDSSE